MVIGHSRAKGLVGGDIVSTNKTWSPRDPVEFSCTKILNDLSYISLYHSHIDVQMLTDLTAYWSYLIRAHEITAGEAFQSPD
jgi:hypothetical protein